ncbi:MAG: hypothetical protein KC766_04660 [Myxococcales bacterium]|nr:hypothetical protein [Myxococcales bacterium]
MPDPTLELNRHFTQRYAQSRASAFARALEADRPTIIRVESDLVFLRRGCRKRAEILGERYHAFKSVAHVPATLALALVQTPPPTTPQLQDLAEDVRGLLGSDRALAEMRSVLEPCSKLLEAWLGARRGSARAAPDEDRVKAFKLAAQPAIGPCMRAAAQSELDDLHRTVSAWTRDFQHSDWRALKVVICASHQARYRESTKLYFLRLLAERLPAKETEEAKAAESEHQVIYAENCATEEEALNLLATHHVDRDLAGFLLGDSASLQRDVVGDTFARLLDELFG